ncbi:MAG TPA: nidogen-like domain-containing protein [Acidimicrobiales bacterium]|nr:nidogen-like domain-containing protein [Acidimicrobiales bacterium]
MQDKHRPATPTRPRAVLGVVVALALAAATLVAAAPAQAAHSSPAITDAGCLANTLAANDDGSTGEVALPFTVNFFGVPYTSLYVNNNGNVTFGEELGTFTPFALTADTPPIIAPFFADVDTRGAGSSLVTYGTIPASPAFGGRDVFCVNWRDVGYFSSQDDKLNDFQLLLVDRSDVAAGDFDIYFNYEQILWETGSASGGTDGFGGSSAGAGYAGGTGSPSSFFELPCSRINGACLDSNAATGLHNTSTNSTLAGRHIFAIRSGGQTFTGAISGTVSDGAGGISGAFVQVCRPAASQGVFCPFTGLTGSAGTYLAANLPPGPYVVSVSPPGNLSPQSRSVDLADGQQLVVDFVVQAPQPPPPGTSIDDDTPPGQIPSVIVGQPVTLVTTGCTGGTATYTITGEYGGSISGSLAEGPPGTYSSTFAIPFTGPATVNIDIACPDTTEEDVDFNIYIDPSGFVRTVAGDPIVGATVTLFRSDTEAGPFTQVPDGSVLMSPSNRTNPDATDGTGHFGWDVVAGFYFVRAEAPGCVSPADSSQAFVDTEILTIPPPVTDLDIRLDCDGSTGTDSALTFTGTGTTSASRARLGGSMDCDDGSRFRISLTVTQGESTGTGISTGACTGAEQPVRLTAMLSSGPGFAPGPARACAVVEVGIPGERTLTSTGEVCADVVLS